jgi:beta-N-acetylhexosaminidase
MIRDNGELSLEAKVGQLFFIGISGPELDENTRTLLDEISPGGVCLFSRNVRTAEQTRELLTALRECLPVTPLLSVDQEGGLVDRLRRIMTPMPAPNRLRTAEDAAELGAITGETLRALGFNMDFAPVVDVIDAERGKHTNGIFSREFGGSAHEVAKRAGAFLRSLQNAGIVGCLKHFPGLGASRVDSHEELPEVGISEAEIESIDLYPYRTLLDQTHAVMIGHATFPRLPLQEMDGDGKPLPSSLSYNFVTTLLRERLGFDGLVITDDLEMGAIVRNYGVGEACKMAVQAGVDMLAICADPERIREGYRAVMTAVNDGEISAERLDTGVGRVEHVRSILASPHEYNPNLITSLSTRVVELNERLEQTA